jgi:hypothetical protein
MTSGHPRLGNDPLGWRARNAPSSNSNTPMTIFLAATIGACALVVTWAIGLNADVSGLIALAILGLGVLAQMASSSRAS